MKNKIKTFKIKGFVEVEVYAEVKALNLKQALRIAKNLPNTEFTDGNHVSRVQDLEIYK